MTLGMIYSFPKNLVVPFVGMRCQNKLTLDPILYGSYIFSKTFITSSHEILHFHEGGELPEVV